MLIEISDDTADQLFRDMFAEDYKMMRAIIADLEAKSELRDFESEDLQSNRKWLQAMETLMDYYIGYSWREKITT